MSRLPQVLRASVELTVIATAAWLLLIWIVPA